jgi:hypothetical protein
MPIPVGYKIVTGSPDQAAPPVSAARHSIPRRALVQLGMLSRSGVRADDRMAPGLPVTLVTHPGTYPRPRFFRSGHAESLRTGRQSDAREARNRMSILWIILIVILVLALLGFFSRGRW